MQEVVLGQESFHKLMRKPGVSDCKCRFLAGTQHERDRKKEEEKSLDSRRCEREIGRQGKYSKALLLLFP